MTPLQLQAAGGVLFRRKEEFRRYENGEMAPPVPDGVEVLLIHRRGVWDLPKGKMEEGEGHEDCARREVAEEVGLDRLPRITAFLVKTFHSYREQDRAVEKITFWYAMDGEPFGAFTPQREEQIERVAWVPLAEARSRVGYDNLVEVLDAFRALLEGGQGTDP
ncbi:MAG: NUDIX domain-containing protein [Balneolaceae bacterium]|nr:NUDIX domain-containing protein [Balneolaceae bacterium]